MLYRVKLDNFEGPYDLLLYLIRKHEVDIYDIPIYEIAEQFLEYIGLMKLLDLEIAGEFIEMTAILMNIKAKMLLPKPYGVPDDEIEDPRTELVERLIEYQRFKEAAEKMSGLEEYHRKLYKRENAKPEIEKEPATNEEYLQDVSLFDLLLALKTALKNMPKITHHEVRKIDVTIEQQSEAILLLLKKKPMLLFSELMKKYTEKIVIIVTFLALLDLITKKVIEVKQSAVFDDIRIKQKDQN